MSVEIDLYPEKFILNLWRNGALADHLEMCYKRNLAEKLLEGIDKILKRNKIEKIDLKSIELLKKPDKNRTSDRIALSVAEAFRALSKQ